MRTLSTPGPRHNPSPIPRLAQGGLDRHAAAVPRDDQPTPAPDDVVATISPAQDDVAVVLGGLTVLVLEDGGVEATLHHVLDVAVRVVAGCDAGSVTITADGQPRTAAHTDERTLAVDVDQYEAGEGPCLEASATQTVLRVDVDEAAHRWPAFTRAARADGVRSFLAAPLAVKGEPLGSLNLYSRSSDGFASLDEAFVRLLTLQASALIANSLRLAEMRTLTSQLEDALQSRAVIEQAKGALMGSLGINADEAFGVLRNRSQHTNTKLRDVATEMVARANAGQPPRAS